MGSQAQEVVEGLLWISYSSAQCKKLGQNCICVFAPHVHEAIRTRTCRANLSRFAERGSELAPQSRSCEEQRGVQTMWSPACRFFIFSLVKIRASCTVVKCRIGCRIRPRIRPRVRFRFRRNSRQMHCNDELSLAEHFWHASFDFAESF